jgi:hypothetical protein
VRRLLLASVAFLWPLPPAAGVAPPPASAPQAALAGEDFKGKTLVITMKTAAKDGRVAGGVLEKACLRKLGERTFLVGEVPDLGQAKFKGLKVWVAVDDIAQVLEFESAEDVKRYYAEHDKALGKKDDQ